MIESMYVAIAEKIESLFSSADIFLDPLPQTFEAPCFWVRLLSASQEHRLNNRYEYTLNFDVVYYPEDEEKPSAEINDTALALSLGLEYVQVGEDCLVRGSDIKAEAQDGVLHVFVTYNFFASVPYDRGILMRKLVQLYKYKE